MIRFRKIIGAMALLSLQSMLQCSGYQAPTAHGGGDVVTTGSAVGFLYYGNGKPADRASVEAVPYGGLPNSLPFKYSNETDSNGRYVFSNLPSGDYNIYCVRDSLRAMLERRRIQGEVTLPNDTLKPPGRIDGFVRLAGGEDCRTVLIMIKGGDNNLITGPFDTTGAFTLDSLAEGHYLIRFVTTYPYPVLDTAFSVVSGKSTGAGTIIMTKTP